MDFKDRRVWITGASSGIGEALAVAFRQAGAKLVLSARREDVLKRVQTLCGGEPNTHMLPMDVTNSAELPEKTRLALGIFNGIDIMVLNAGITQRSLTRDTHETVYRQLMEVNFFATESLARAVLPSMLAQKSGHMVVISSVAGKFGVPLRSGYSAFKFALHGFFEVLRAEEEKNGIHVTMVCPGYIRTDISLSAFQGRRQQTCQDGSRNCPGHARGRMRQAHTAGSCARQKGDYCGCQKRTGFCVSQTLLP
jgi:short-subunit dehydrogenase